VQHHYSSRPQEVPASHISVPLDLHTGVPSGRIPVPPDPLTGVSSGQIPVPPNLLTGVPSGHIPVLTEVPSAQIPVPPDLTAAPFRGSGASPGGQTGRKQEGHVPGGGPAEAPPPYIFRRNLGRKGASDKGALHTPSRVGGYRSCSIIIAPAHKRYPPATFLYPWISTQGCLRAEFLYPQIPSQEYPPAKFLYPQISSQEYPPATFLYSQRCLRPKFLFPRISQRLPSGEAGPVPGVKQEGNRKDMSRGGVQPRHPPHIYLEEIWGGKEPVTKVHSTRRAGSADIVRAASL
jgi:hypothetical protein